MQCRTHLVSSCAINLFLFSPTSISLLAITSVSACLGGVISDIDSRKSESSQILSKINSFVLLIALLLGIISYYKLFDIYKYINIDYINYLITFLLTLLICNIGSNTHHRSFTHSFLFIIFMFLILSISFNNNFIYPFIIGMISHIILDFTNHIGITLFFLISSYLIIGPFFELLHINYISYLK